VASAPNPADPAALAATGAASARAVRAGTLEHPADYRELGLRPGIEGLRDLMERLLDPAGGCPWDRAQTLDSLRPYLIEEAHEVLEAMHDPPSHRDELGDLLFQVVFHSAIRAREGHFDFDGVVAAIRDKMIRRHPHVFARAAEGEPELTEAEVMRRWEAIKHAERGSDDRPRDPLRGVPRGLPALQRAWRLQHKAAAVGFDWPDVAGAWSKLDEELAELREAAATPDLEHATEELGDVLFVLVRLAHKLGLDAEEALRRANAKFERRFGGVMARAHAAGIDPSDAGLERLDGWWDAVKREERAAAAAADRADVGPSDRARE
jgi:tetrapyrrole methylase family protein/MazG family protein/ATP diphosphatase